MKLLKLLCKFILVFTIAISMLISSSAFLYHQTNSTGLIDGVFTPRLTTDPYYIKYHISTMYSFSPYTSYVREAISNWYSSSEQIDLTETTSYETSVLDFKGYNGESPTYSDHADVLGFTRVYCGDGAYTGNNQTYDYSDQIPTDYWMAEVYINYVKIPSTTLNTIEGQRKLKAVAAHEIGHALGLGHVAGIQYIMYHNYAETLTIVPTASEKVAVRELYDYR